MFPSFKEKLDIKDSQNKWSESVFLKIKNWFTVCMMYMYYVVWFCNIDFVLLGFITTLHSVVEDGNSTTKKTCKHSQRHEPHV